MLVSEYVVLPELLLNSRAHKKKKFAQKLFQAYFCKTLLNHLDVCLRFLLNLTFLSGSLPATDVMYNKNLS